MQEYFLNLSIQQEMPLVMVGASGTGKTFISSSLIESLSTEKFINNIVNFSARTSVNYTQGMLFRELPVASNTGWVYINQKINS